MSKKWPIVYFIICCAALLYKGDLYASHIIGGDVTYDLVSYNEDSTLVTYSIQFIIYRDTAGLPLDILADFGVFRQQIGMPWESYQVINGIDIGQIDEVNALNDPCKDELLSELIIESGTYNFEVTLEVGDYNYMIAYQRCCRNYTITNILNPGETGAVYDIIVTPQAQRRGNNSPAFKTYPPIFVCLGFDFDFDHSAIDHEGDELRYSFCTPFISGVNPGSAPPICCDCVKPDPETCLPGFDNVTYTDIYSEDNPVGGDPQITIDPVTGRISGVPNIMGSYVVGVCVEEFRDGELIGSYRRDFEFNVEVCTPRVFADLKSDTLILDSVGQVSRRVHSFTSCDPVLNIENLSTDIDFINDYKWVISGADNTPTIELQGIQHRDINIELPGPGIYRGYMVLNDLEICVDTAFIRINILPLVDLSFEFDFDPCGPGPVQLINTSMYDAGLSLDWSWQVDGREVSQLENAVMNSPDIGEYEVALHVIDEQDCAASTDQELYYDYYTTPLVEDFLARTICPGDTVHFDGRVVTQTGTYEQLYTTMYEGCDSLLRTLTVAFYEPPQVITTDTTICNGTSIFFDGHIRDTPGTYQQALPYEGADCDSLVYRLQLEVSPFPILLDVDTTLCADDSILFQNRWIHSAGSYNYVVKSATTSCDSFHYTLSVDFGLPLAFKDRDTVICAGDSILFDQRWVSESGYYEGLYKDAMGCDSLISSLEIVVSDSLIVDVISDDSIRPYLDYPIDVFVNRDNITIMWTPSEGLSCDDCLDPIVNIDGDRTYLLEVEDGMGCYMSTEVTFYVDPFVNFYLPNVIAKQPPVNAVNQFFFLHCNPDYEFQYNMHIYDRWGSEVGKRMNISTNVADDGWTSGDFLPGVYVYYIEVLADIKPRILVGDLTVLK